MDFVVPIVLGLLMVLKSTGVRLVARVSSEVPPDKGSWSVEGGSRGRYPDP